MACQSTRRMRPIATRMASSLRRRDALLTSLVLGLLAYSWMFSAVSVPNERSRAYLTMALWDHGSLTIDEPVRRFGRVYDLASFGGHFFTDKAPGASLLLVPIYAAARLLHPSRAVDVIEVIDLGRTWLMLPCALAGFWLLRSLSRALSISEPALDVSSLGFSLASAMLHYGGALYGHALVAVALLAALRCHAAAGSFGQPCSPGRRRLWLAAVGGWAGLCGLCEYQAVILAALLVVPLLVRRSGWLQDMLSFAAGAAPFALALLWYDAHAFGSPFALGYQHLVATSLQDLHGEGYLGATYPHPRALLGLLFSLHRGLFPTAPLLGLGLLALLPGWRFMPRTLWLTSVLSVAYLLLIVASSSVWFGGWSYGPRLLVPGFGMLAIAAGFGLDRLTATSWQVLGRTAVLFGMLINVSVAATFPELPEVFLKPLPDSILPLLEAGFVAPNLACKLSALGWPNLLPLCTLLAIAAGFVAFRGIGLKPALLSLALAGGALLGMGGAAPSISPLEQQRWLRQVQAWHSAENRCVSAPTST
jgi:hypothetical protein